MGWPCHFVGYTATSDTRSQFKWQLLDFQPNCANESGKVAEDGRVGDPEETPKPDHVGHVENELTEYLFLSLSLSLSLSLLCFNFLFNFQNKNITYKEISQQSVYLHILCKAISVKQYVPKVHFPFISQSSKKKKISSQYVIEDYNLTVRLLCPHQIGPLLPG